MIGSWEKRKQIAVVVAMACAGCAARADGEPTEDVGTAEQAITNGQDDNQDPAVVALLSHGQVFCTGVLITSHVVLTAAHCVDPTPPDQVYFGAKPSDKSGTLVAVTDSKEFPDFDQDTLANDVALVALADAAPAAPLPVRTGELDASFVGMPIRIVGFGAQAANDAGNIRKRSGATKIESYDADTFKFEPGPSQTCSGDSGGPALATLGGKEAIVGVTSSGDVDCKTYGQDMRVDRYVPFLTSFSKAYSAKIAAANAPKSGGCSAAPLAGGRGAWGFAFAACLILWRRRTMCARKGAAPRGEPSPCARGTFSA